MGEMRFQEGLERLESMVKALEGDALELEDALKYYEEGISLYRKLLTFLGEAEKKIQVLSGEREGELLWKEYKEAHEQSEDGDSKSQ